MKWKKEKPDIPEWGEREHVTSFLWFPRTIRGETRWLETATIEYIYTYAFSVSKSRGTGCWFPYKWVR